MKRAAFMTALAVAFLFLDFNIADGQTLGTAFTYQGQLKDAGQPADGNYNFNFRVFSAQNGGIQIGPSLSYNNWPVTDGLFVVELDFTPAAFNANTTPGKRWLQVAVNGTVLQSRQPLTAVPYSIQTRGIDVVEDGGGMRVGVGEAGYQAFNVFTDTTGTGGMSVHTEAGGDPAYYYRSGTIEGVRTYYDSNEENWKLYNGGDRLIVSPHGFVGINRNYRIQSSETFGVYRDTDDPGDHNPNVWGGMFIDTNTDGRPYYGYAVDGDNIGYTYMDGATDKWHLVNDGIRLTVLDSGFVGIGEEQPMFTLEVNGSAGKPGGGSWANSSDRRLKKNIKDLEGSLEKLMKVRGVTFEYLDPKSINELEGERVGVIAQELEKVFPDWVDERGDGYKAVTFRGFEAIAVEAIRELRDEKNKQVELLEKANVELQDNNAELRDRLEMLESQIQQLVEAVQTQQR